VKKSADDLIPSSCDEKAKNTEENLTEAVLLKTACGSPTYAAPELVLSSKACNIQN
jgi:hypothetical protein